MSLERLNYLKRIVTVSMIGHLAPDEQADLTELIDAEIKHIESRRKVPLVPCRGCAAGKPMGPWVSYASGSRKVRYICAKCGTEGDGCTTDQEARIAWNEAQKGGEQ